MLKHKKSAFLGKKKKNWWLPCFHSRCVHFWSKTGVFVVWLVIFFFFHLPNNRQKVHASIYGWLYCLHQVARELQQPLQLQSTLEKSVQNGPRFFWNGSWSFCCISWTLSEYTVPFVDAFCEYEHLGCKQVTTATLTFHWQVGMPGLSAWCFFKLLNEWMLSHHIDSFWHLLTEKKKCLPIPSISLAFVCFPSEELTCCIDEPFF